MKKKETWQEPGAKITAPVHNVHQLHYRRIMLERERERENLIAFYENRKEEQKTDIQIVCILRW